jgi:anti-sigma B factor antagonist
MELQRQDFDEQQRTRSAPASGVEQFHLVGLNGTRVVVATGEIDMASAPALWEAMSEAIATGQGDVIVDLSGVTFIDSQGLNVLLRAYKMLSPEGRGVCLRSPRPQTRQALEVSGVASVFTVDG